MKLWWYVARSSGIVAWVLLGAAVVWGVLLATRFLGSKPRPAWLLDLHRWLGGLAVTFTGIHLLGLVLDDYVEFGARELLIPMASTWRPAAVAWGVVSLYVLIAVQATSLAMQHLPRRLWKWIHMSSFGLFFVASIHAGMAGTDVTTWAYRVVAVVLVPTVAFFSVYRATSITDPKKPGRRPTTPEPSPAPVKTPVPDLEMTG